MATKQIDPGTGYRILEVGETIIKTDEAWSHIYNSWGRTGCAGLKVESYDGFPYRRKVDPGAGYRILEIGEVICPDDEVFDSVTDSWQKTWCAGLSVDPPDALLYRRRISLRPPLGLRPQNIAHQERLSEVRQAIQRYVDAKLDVPHEWIAEYFDLTL